MSIDPKFRVKLEELLNMHGVDNELNTPDYILADYLMGCLVNLNTTVEAAANHTEGRELKSLYLFTDSDDLTPYKVNG